MLATNAVIRLERRLKYEIITTTNLYDKKVNNVRQNTTPSLYDKKVKNVRQNTTTSLYNKKVNNVTQNTT
jgi:hypothetical protein